MLGLILGLILAFVPFPGSTFVARLIDTFIALPTFLVTLALTFLYGSAGMLNGALTQGFGLSEPPVHFLYSAWGVILAEVTVYTPFVLRPLLAAFSLVDQSQIEVAGLLDRRRQPLPAAHRQRVRHRAVHRRQRRHHAATSDLRQGDPRVGLSSGLRYRDGQYRALAWALLALSPRGATARRLSRMLVWSRSGRFVVWLVAALLIGVIFLAPLAVILAASLAQQWNGVLPTGFTFEHYRDAGSGASGDAVFASLITGLVASLLALLCGSWAALSLRAQGEAWSRSLGLLFFVPSAVPSVSVGLGLLVAFSQRPLLLNGTTAIVILAHFVLISAFSFGNVSAGLARLPPDYEEVASSLGARPTYRLFKVTLPLIAPYLIAAFGLSFALSMGELGATVMVYPPGWVTLPVAIFGLTDRGDIFSGAALTMILVAATLALLVGLERLPLGAIGRRA
jgi:2-aminoethylphosphonate transport system permease protein